MSVRTDEEEYEFSAGSEGAIAFWYPESMTPKHPKFETDMILLQLELLKHHSYLMDHSSKRRALRTAEVLNAKLRGKEVCWDAQSV